MRIAHAFFFLSLVVLAFGDEDTPTQAATEDDLVTRIKTLVAENTVMIFSKARAQHATIVN